MIQANELRIGNKLNFLGDVVTFKNITEIREDGIFWIKTFEPKIESKNFHFKPIEITEDWLLKFGFEKSNSNTEFYTFDLSKLSIHLKSKQYADGRTYFNSWCIIEKQIEYVHQLQNLYFCLTGSELTVA